MIVLAPIRIVFDRLVIEVPFRPTRSSIMILEDSEKVLNRTGWSSAAAELRQEDEISCTRLPTTTVPGYALTMTFPNTSSSRPQGMSYSQHLRRNAALENAPIIDWYARSD